MIPTPALHHITAVARDAQANVDFYEGVLGQRLVKKTVNFDDPGTHHLYYGDEAGSPGTIITFFPWRHVGDGRLGTGETSRVLYAAPPESLGYWAERLSAAGTEITEVEERFGEQILHFRDPGGMRVGIVGTGATGDVQHWLAGPIPADAALRGFLAAELRLTDVEPTAAVLTEILGYRVDGVDGTTHRFRSVSDDVGHYIDVLVVPAAERGLFGAGSIHHIAFRGADDDALLDYRNELAANGIGVTPIRDRQYFHSIYFHEPGGVLFEIATDGPGFTSDEPLESLGETLKIPPWLEARRPEIERRLVPFQRPRSTLRGAS